LKNTLSKAFKSVKNYVVRQFQLLDENKVFVHTAATSYYILFALAPFLILIVALIPYTPLTKESIIFGMNNVLPATLASFGETLINEIYNLSGIILPISLVVILWTASLGVKSCREALTQIYHFYDHKNLVKRYGAYIVCTLIFIVLLMVVIIFGVLGQPIYDLIADFVPELPGVIGKLLQFHNILSILATFTICTISYLYLPPSKNKFKEQWVGIVFAVVIQFAFSKIFSWYITIVNGYSMYGSLAIIVVILFYVYWSIFILFLGAQINADIKKQRDLKNEETF